MTTNPIIGAAEVTHQIVERKVGDLWVDPQVQRALKKPRVDQIAASFNPDALGVLTTSFRSPGRIHIIDGQHRYRAAEAAGYAGVIVTTEYRGLTIPQEAALFRQLNATEKVGAVDQFLVACVEQDPDALALARVFVDNGWTLANTAANGRISAIRSIQRVYQKSPEAAAATIATVTAAWGHTPTAVQGSILEGVGLMLARYGDLVDLTDLAKRLAAYPGGPESLIGYARGYRSARVGNLSSQVAWVVTNHYNQRRRASALPPWQ